MLTSYIIHPKTKAKATAEDKPSKAKAELNAEV